jgi:D-serine deaminase-like pyridoxal phosphate-dependent protein
LNWEKDLPSYGALAMHIHELPTPAVLVNVDRIVRNVSRVMEAAKRY